VQRRKNAEMESQIVRVGVRQMGIVKTRKSMMQEKEDRIGGAAQQSTCG